LFFFFFFFNDTATTEIYTLSLHDALPICQAKYDRCSDDSAKERSEPHTTCFEDYRDCGQKCDAAVASDPATKANQGVTISETGAAVVESGNTVITAGAPVVSKGR